MKLPLRVLIVDDHSLFRRGLAEILEEHENIQLVGEADSGDRAIELVKTLTPDVILMDVHMPGGGGVEAVRKLKKDTDIRILMLTVSENDKDLLSAIEAGADAYLLKNLDPDQLIDAIVEVAKGYNVVAPELTQHLMKTAISSKLANEASVGLSAREEEVLFHLSKGASTEEIAKSLFISPNTVKTHVSKILRKLKAGNRAEAVAKAMSMGLITKRF